MERKLTAILCADVHGYSRLMGEDEEATHRTLPAYRKLIDSLIEQHRGRFVNSAGVAPDNWALKVGGLVARPSVFSLDQLKRIPQTGMRIRHHCVEGWSAVAEWQGRAAPRDRPDGWREARRAVRRVPFIRQRLLFDVDIESSLHPQTILAYGMNGRPLYPDHGAPLRLYSPVKLGYKMVKYLTEVNLLPTRAGGYWEDQGYDWYGGV